MKFNFQVLPNRCLEFKFKKGNWKIVLMIGLEFKLQDLWIGCYWDLKPIDNHIWICIIPCLPIHIHWCRVPTGFKSKEKNE